MVKSGQVSIVYQVVLPEPRWPIQWHSNSIALSQLPAYNARPQTVHQVVCLFTLQPLLVLILPTPEGGQAKLAWVVDQTQRGCEHDSNPRTVTHPSTNRDWCRLTTLIATDASTTTPNHRLLHDIKLKMTFTTKTKPSRRWHTESNRKLHEVNAVCGLGW